MNWSDIINGLFESMASIFLLLNIIKLYKDKQIKGVSILSTGFFASWGYWNCLFYPYNGHMFSAIAGIFVALFNTIWVIQMLYYKNKRIVK